MTRTQIQIGEIKFNFLLPHQGTLPEDNPIKESDSDFEEETPSTPTSLTTTPQPDSLTTTKPDPSTTTSTTNDPTSITTSATAIEKPDIPYATLIAQSLLSHPRRRRTLQEIYAWIQDHHAYFKGKNKSWQSSIRHNLMSSPAFVCYGPRPGEVDTGESKKSKRGKDEWGISPEYEGLIGDLSAKEGDTDKLSTKLTKKKTVSGEKPKPEKDKVEKVKEEKETKEGKNGKVNLGTTTSRDPKTTSPAPQSTSQTDDKDKSKLEELVKNMQGKGVDMGALLQEALAKMKGIPGLPIKSPIPTLNNTAIHNNMNANTTPVTTSISSPAIVQPPAKRLKHTFPPTIASPTPASTQSTSMTPQKQNTNTSNPSTNTGLNTGVPPIQMPMPLPYAAAKAAPIPVVGAAANTPGPQIKQEFPPLQAPVPSLGFQMPAMGQIQGRSMAGQARPTSTTPVGGLGSPAKMSESTVSPEPVSVPGMKVGVQQVGHQSVEPGIVMQNGDGATKPPETAASKRSPRGKKRGLPE